MRWFGCAALVAVAACRPTPHGVTAEVRRARLTAIRETAAQMGVTNGALIAGIAVSETHLAHCWSEATWACPGPRAHDCADGPVIAGAADGPCSLEQGGLGMFQFDAGTYTDTLARDGRGILTVNGNIAKAVEFVVNKVIADIPGVTDWVSAVRWINAVPLIAGDPVTEQWAALLACRYNGCCAKTPTCATRAAGYRDNAIKLLAAEGVEFWRTADRCTALPASGVIDERGPCYLAGGDPQRWHHDDGGYAATLDYAMTSAAASPGAFGVWWLKVPRAGNYRVDVWLPGVVAQAKGATYQIAHDGRSDSIMLDQTRAPDGGGFVALGVFAFAGDGDEYVRLDDNTGEAGKALVFDAVRAVATDAPAVVADAGCAAAGGDPRGALLVGLALWLARRRQTAG